MGRVSEENEGSVKLTGGSPRACRSEPGLLRSSKGESDFHRYTWVFDPIEHAFGNVSLGFGMKAPTGSSARKGTYYLLSGSEQRDLDPSTQLGDGGWGLIGELEAFQRIFRRTTVYFAGSYLANPKDHSNAVFHVPCGIIAPVAITDEYSAHAGLTGATAVSAEFKQEAMRLVTRRGVLQAQAARDRAIHVSLLRV